MSVVAIETELYDVLGVSPTATGGMLRGIATWGAYFNPRLSLRRDQEGISQEGPYVRPLFRMQS